MLTDLTNRQREILDFIAEKITTRGFGPTLREIADAFGIVTTNGVKCHLDSSERKGFIIRTPHLARGISLAARYKAGIPVLTLTDIARSGGW